MNWGLIILFILLCGLTKLIAFILDPQRHGKKEMEALRRFEKSKNLNKR